MKPMRTRLFILFLAAVLIVGCIPMVGFAAENTTDFLGGDGSAANPYLISNVTHLANVSRYSTAHFLLLTDIDLGGAEFTPIKNSKGTFSGTFDGGGHTISNVQLRSAYNYRLGLFIENTGTIKNLRVENVDVYYYPGGVCYLGGIAAENKGTISNCYVSGVVDASSTYNNSTAYTGGITGVNHAKVEYCFADAKVMANVEQSGYSGGIAGNNQGTIEYCANAGSITGPSPWDVYRGGIVGSNRGTVSNCLNTGYVGYESSLGRTCTFGGIAGYSTVDRYVYGISNCVNSGEVYYDHSAVPYEGYYSASGEIVGRVYGELSMEGCYYLRATASSVGVGMGEGTATGCDLEQFTDAATFTALDMENTWGFTGDDYKYPVLKAFADYYRTSIPEDTVHFAGGRGTAWDPYRIETKQQLNTVRDFPDACFLLMNDLSFTAEDFQAGGALHNELGYWEPIAEFTGSFNGNGHTLSGISFSADTELNGETTSAVFRMFDKNAGSIKNLTLSDVRIDISASVLLEQQHDGSIRGSGLAATNTGEIVNCHISGTINMNLELVPGTTYTYDYPTADTYAALLCEDNRGVIKGCSATGKLTAGICGTVDYNRVWPDIYIGGIASTNSGIIDTCKANVDISVTTDQMVTSYDITNYSIHIYAGGIAGENGSSISLATVRNSTSKGSITVNATSNMEVTSPGYATTAQGGMHHLTYAGGIAGYVGADSEVYNCMSSCSVSGSLHYSGSETKYASTTITMEHYVGGVAGYSLGHMSNCYSTSYVTMNVVDGHTFDQRERKFYAGGVVGYTATDSSMTNCYSAGSVSASGTGCNTYAGGAYGFGPYNLKPKGIYALEGNCSGTASGTNYTVSLTPEQMTLQESFAGYDFQDIWCFDSSDGYAYPRLQAELGTLTKLEILGNPGVVTTVEGVMPDVSHIQVQLTYSNGRVSTVSMDANFLSALDLAQIGTQTVPVSLRGVTAETQLTVQVNAKSLAGISLKEDTDAIMYLPTQENLILDYTQLKLLYDNGSFEYIPVTQDMLSHLDKTIEGTQMLTVTYEGFTTALPVNVYIPYEITVTYPTKKDYVQGQPLDLTGSTTQIQFRCGDKTWLQEYKTTEADSVEYNTQAIGSVTVTVTKCGLSSTFIITVNPRVVTYVRMVQPTKLTYVTGEDLDLTGGYLTYIFESSDNYSENVPLTTDMISGYDPNTAGFQTLAVTAEGYSGSFMIRVIERNVTAIALTTLPETLVYAEGTAAADVTGGVLTVTYDDGTQDEVAVTAEMVSGFDGSEVGTQSLTVRYKDFTVSYNVTVEHVYTVRVKKASCTEQGCTIFSCLVCGESYEADFVDALGHAFGAWETVREPNYLENGLQERHCERCDAVESEEINNNPFPDVPNNSFKDYILWCSYEGIITGDRAGNFNPTNTVTRGQFIIMLWRAAGKPEPTQYKAFPDVTENSSFYKAVCWAVEKGITNGQKNGNFGVNDPCTRGHVALFLYRYAGQPEVESKASFPDVTGGTYYKAVCWLVEQGITNGQTDGKFGVSNPCQRRHVAKFLYLYLIETEQYKENA